MVSHRYETTVYPRIAVGTSTGSVALFYLKNPSAFFDVLMTTLSKSDVVNFYRDSFFGILGWLDTRFSEKTYDYLAKCMLLIALFSVSVKKLYTEWTPRLAVLFCALFSIFLIFFALLISNNPHPATQIEGVQGRYFLVPMIMIAYAISDGSKLYEGIFRKIALLPVIFLGAFTIYSTPRLLIERYYLTPRQQFEQTSVVMRTSAPLDQKNPIILMSRSHKRDLPLKRVGIRFSTHNRKNPGQAQLRLTGSDGRTLAIPFNLSILADNKYKYFELDSKPYSSGRIIYLTGGGISAWEAHEKKGPAETCLIFEYTNGKKLYTPACPSS